MKSLVICVPTYRRNAELAELIDALQAQALPPAESVQVRLIIIDNNPGGDAAPVIEAAVAKAFPIAYLHETRAGVTHVRNRALDATAEDDLLVFIDDDELPADGWLAELYRRYEESGAAVVFGSVEARYESVAPDWMVSGGFHDKKVLSDGPRTLPGATDNCLIDLASVRRHGLAFDPALTLIGGEDTLFFDALLRRGEVFADAAGAVTYERIPTDRATLSWLIKRWRRTGLTDARMIAGHRGGGRLATWRAGLDGLIRIGVGGPLAGLSWLAGGMKTTTPMARFLYTYQRGLGMIDFVARRDINEYGR